MKVIRLSGDITLVASLLIIVFVSAILGESRVSPFKFPVIKNENNKEEILGKLLKKAGKFGNQSKITLANLFNILNVNLKNYLNCIEKYLKIVFKPCSAKYN